MSAVAQRGKHSKDGGQSFSSEGRGAEDSHRVWYSPESCYIKCLIETSSELCVRKHLCDILLIQNWLEK